MTKSDCVTQYFDIIFAWWRNVLTLITQLIFVIAFYSAEKTENFPLFLTTCYHIVITIITDFFEIMITMKYYHHQDRFTHSQLTNPIRSSEGKLFTRRSHWISSGNQLLFSINLYNGLFIWASGQRHWTSSGMLLHDLSPLGAWDHGNASFLAFNLWSRTIFLK